ncbi:17.8 kDa class I heat shock protein-like [Papaver somniferum]|uniref:17.8 kDa class I heat shock protein-like n=1 Tax=Papaver somniferum TaxID=3469 RepID=UPI000E6FEC78|nr:17.8 kDa class I heat shock protein-like [Papaver somniferum]
MSIIPSIFGVRSNIFDPFSSLWDPFSSPSFSIMRTKFPNEATQFANTQIDWKETPESHVFKADIPGLKKEELKVEVEEGKILQISRERNKEKEEKNDQWNRIERIGGKFLRQFKLPENAKVDQVKATMGNGVLIIIVPKVAEKNPEVKSVEIFVKTRRQLWNRIL